MSEVDSGPQRYETIVIVGGGCYGGYYVRQLQRAARSGALTATALHVVDRDANCAVARGLRGETVETPVPLLAGEDLASPIPTSVVVAEWREYFANYLSRAAGDRDYYRHDAIVPSPLMPHLMAEWIVERARHRWSDRAVTTSPLAAPIAVPWQRAGADGTHYVSFAEWTCPINCVEPRVCPATRDARDWSLPPTVASYAQGIGASSAVMFCRHRAFGVGMFDTAEVTAADDVVSAIGNAGGEVLIGTTSHCHGAITRLVVGPTPVQSDSPNR
jgi:hypothetical protein